MDDFSTLGKRIMYGLEKSGKVQADLCRFTGCKSSTVSMWCSDKVKNLSSENALKVSTLLNINYNWLVTGKGSPDAEDVVSLPDDVLADDPYVQIPEYSVECGAGPGTTPTYSEIESSIPATYRQSYFTSKGISPDDCKRFTVHGDSMQPTLFNGDKILVNTADNVTISNNHVYAINVNDEVKVKRLIRLINGDLVIKSDNKSYPDEIIPHDSDEINFSIIGRVIEKAGNGGL